MNGNAARILRKEERGHEERKSRDPGFRFFFFKVVERPHEEQAKGVDRMSKTNGGRRSVSFSTSLMV